MMRVGKCWVGYVLLGAATWVGCGPSDPLNRQSVSGTVMVDGSPLKVGNISFQPQDRAGVPGGARIDAGKFTIAKEKGLPPGKYIVRINAAGAEQPLDPDAPPEAPPKPPLELIPPEYNVKSTQTVEVKQGNNVFNFDIKLKK